MRPPFSLISHTESTETVECLERWLEQARAGELLGIAAVKLYKRRQFSVHACGEAHRSPVFAKGCVGMLDDDLRRRIRGD